jgi:hypothetical protein
LEFFHLTNGYGRGIVGVPARAVGMVDKGRLFKQKQRLRFIGGFRKALWVVYGWVILRALSDPPIGGLVLALGFVTLLLVEARLVDLDLVIEMEKERLKEEHGEDLNWIVDLPWP